jgi:hypothetical protein
MLDVGGLSNRRNDLIVIDDANFPAVNFKSRASIATYANPLSFLAPLLRIIPKLVRVFVGQRA